MNIRTTTFSLMIAASLGVAFTQTAKADSHDDASASASLGMRFGFGPNEIKSGNSRHAAAPLSFGPHAGAVPRNILGIDPTFVAKAPPPPPVARPMPAMPVPAVQAKVIAQKPAQVPDVLQSIFGHPAPPAPPALIANGADPLTPPQGATAKPASGPSTHSTRGVSGKLLRPSHAAPRTAYARPLPPVAGYPSGYMPVQTLPSAGIGSQNGATADVNGRILHRH